MKRRINGKITPKFKKEPVIYLPIGNGWHSNTCSKATNKKFTFICQASECKYHARAFFGQEKQGYKGSYSWHREIIRNSVSSMYCPFHNLPLIKVGDKIRIPKNSKKRKTLIQEILNRLKKD